MAQDIQRLLEEKKIAISQGLQERLEVLNTILKLDPEGQTKTVKRLKQNIGRHMDGLYHGVQIELRTKLKLSRFVDAEGNRHLLRRLLPYKKRLQKVVSHDQVITAEKYNYNQPYLIQHTAIKRVEHKKEHLDHAIRLMGKELPEKWHLLSTKVCASGPVSIFLKGKTLRDGLTSAVGKQLSDMVCNTDLVKSGITMSQMIMRQGWPAVDKNEEICVPTEVDDNPAYDGFIMTVDPLHWATFVKSHLLPEDTKAAQVTIYNRGMTEAEEAHLLKYAVTVRAYIPDTPEEMDRKKARLEEIETRLRMPREAFATKGMIACAEDDEEPKLFSESWKFGIPTGGFLLSSNISINRADADYRPGFTKDDIEYGVRFNMQQYALNYTEAEQAVLREEIFIPYIQASTSFETFEREDGIMRWFGAGINILAAGRFKERLLKWVREAATKPRVPGIRRRCLPNPKLGYEINSLGQLIMDVEVPGKWVKDEETGDWELVPPNGWKIGQILRAQRDPSPPLGVSTQWCRIVDVTTNNCTYCGPEPWMTVMLGDYDGDDISIFELRDREGNELFPDKVYHRTPMSEYNTIVGSKIGLNKLAERREASIIIMDYNIGKWDLMARRAVERGLGKDRKLMLEINRAYQTEIWKMKKQVDYAPDKKVLLPMLLQKGPYAIDYINTDDKDWRPSYSAKEVQQCKLYSDLAREAINAANWKPEQHRIDTVAMLKYLRIFGDDNPRWAPRIAEALHLADIQHKKHVRLANTKSPDKMYKIVAAEIETAICMNAIRWAVSETCVQHDLEIEQFKDYLDDDEVKASLEENEQIALDILYKAQIINGRDPMTGRILSVDEMRIATEGYVHVRS